MNEVTQGRRRWGWQTWTIVSCAVAVAVVAVLAAIPVPYAVLRPGPVTNALGDAPGTDHPIITVEAGKEVRVYEPERGVLDFTTVSVAGGPAHRLSALEWLAAHLDRDAVIKPVDEVYPKDATADQIKEADRAMMASSQDGAHIVAARAAGYPVSRTLGVAGVLEESPNAGVIQPGDDLLTFEGKKITTSDDLHAELGRVKAPATVKLGVRREGKAQIIDVKVVEKEGRPVMGILVRYQYDTPLKVTFDSGKVGGPSAGMMFSLALYDKLTQGDLTGGKTIAGTGTIDPEGEVGPIGGIEFKLKGARKAGAEFFIAPESNCQDVRGHEVDGLRVVPVTTFTQAKEVVEKVAADQTENLPSCPAG